MLWLPQGHPDQCTLPKNPHHFSSTSVSALLPHRTISGVIHHRLVQLHSLTAQWEGGKKGEVKGKIRKRWWREGVEEREGGNRRGSGGGEERVGQRERRGRNSNDDADFFLWDSYLEQGG